MIVGKINIEKPICLAPMEDVTELPFRMICKKLGADIVYTEFTSSEALIRDIPKALKKIEIGDAERPVGIQIFGGREASLEGAAKVVERLQPDVIDINCGCWVKNHAMRNEGAGLLRDLSLMEKIIRSVVRATKIPVTVKTRLGWDDNSIVILDVAKMVEQTGAQALTLHCRTRAQGHNGFADWSWLSKIKKIISIPLIGNGDLTTPQDIERMFETGVDGVMIGRGAIANPWIFKQAKYFRETGKLLPEPDVEERLQLCAEHLKLSVEYAKPYNGVIPFRKFYAGYLRGLPHIAQLRSDLMHCTEIVPILDRLNQYRQEITCSAKA